MAAVGDDRGLLMGVAFLANSSFGHQAAFVYPCGKGKAGEGSMSSGGSPAAGDGGEGHSGHGEETVRGGGHHPGDSGVGEESEKKDGGGENPSAALGGEGGEGGEGKGMDLRFNAMGSAGLGGEEAFGFQPAFLAVLLTPPNLLSSFFELSVAGRLFLSRPSHCLDTSSLTSFTISFVVDGSVAEAVPWVLPAFRRVLDRLVVALDHEQERTQFLVRELDLIGHIKTQMFGAPVAEVTQRLIERSEIALVLSSIYHHFSQVTVGQLKSSSFAWWRTLRQPLTLRLNSWLELNLALSLDPLDGARAQNMIDTRLPHAVASLTDCRPWHTLLLLEPGTSIVVRLPPDASPSLRELLLAASPLVSFEDLMVELGIPLVMLYRLALHLQHWGWARIMSTISESTQFTRNWSRVLELGKVGTSPELASLCLQLLAPFDQPRRVRDVERVEDVLWLLKYELIVQVCVYFYFVLPESESGYTSSPYQNAHIRDPASGTTESGASGIGDMTPQEEAWIDAQEQGIQTETLKSLVKYMRGTYCIEEIMWRRGLSRSAIMEVARTFQDVVVIRHVPHKCSLPHVSASDPHVTKRGPPASLHPVAATTTVVVAAASSSQQTPGHPQSSSSSSASSSSAAAASGASLPTLIPTQTQSLGSTEGAPRS